LFGKNTDRVSLDWNKPLSEAHGLVGLKRHYKVANKSDDKKVDVIWERKENHDGSDKNVFKMNMDHGDCRTGTACDMK
jgi:hypothetical protein